MAADLAAYRANRGCVRGAGDCKSPWWTLAAIKRALGQSVLGGVRFPAFSGKFSLSGAWWRICCGRLGLHAVNHPAEQQEEGASRFSIDC